MEEWGSLVRI